MDKWKKSLKRVLAIALAAGMMISLPEISTIAALSTEASSKVVETTESKQSSETESTTVYEEIVDLGTIETSASGISLFSTDSNSVTLKNGNYEKWIDRINVPEYATDLYDKFVEGADNDGVDDVLMDGTTEIEVVTLEFSENPSTSGEADKVFDTMRAVYDAFDRDHPEVFWLSGASKASYSGYTIDGVYQATFYFVLKLDDYDVRAEEYTDISAIKTAISQRDAAVESIVNGAGTTDTVELIEYFNEWLVRNNEYSTTVAAGGTSVDSSHECLSALTGSIGENGPVCEGYARAFKVLCDEVNIPCVLVDGLGNGGAHMWNNVKVDGNWYAADVTWNDPIGGKSGAVSGYENANWLLLGSSEFDATHTMQNIASNGGVEFINGPIVSTTNYVGSLIESITVTNGTVTYGYTTAPTVSVDLHSSATDTATYQWYKKADTNTAIEGATSNTLPTGLDAGTYYCQVTCGEYVKNSEDVVVNKAELTPSLTGSVEKTYDGTTEVTETAAATLSITLDGVVEGDVVLAEATNYTYTDANAGSNILVNATGIKLSGADADNYSIEETTVTANVGTISKLDISKVSVQLNNSVLTYTGLPQTVEVIWGDSKYELKEGTDYTISGATQTEVDNDYKVSITGIGNCEGIVELSFTIEYQSMDTNAIKYNGAEWVDMYNEDVVITAEGYMMSTSLTGTFAETYTVNQDGSNEFGLYFKEKETGYISDKVNLVVYIDRTAPSFDGEGAGISISDNVWKTLLNGITFGIFFNDTQDVSIYAEDNGSGVKAYYYYVDERGFETVMTAEELDQLVFTEGKTCSISKEGNHVVYAYAVDNAGNKSEYICSNGVVIDKTVPTIEVTVPTVDNGNLGDTSATISFTTSEEGKFYYYYNSTVDKIEEIMVVGTNTFTIDGLEPDTEYIVYIYGQDKAGNTSKESTVTFTTQKTLPVFLATPEIKGTYGETVSQMIAILSETSDNNITGTWAISSENANDMPTVGTTTEYVATFTPVDQKKYGISTIAFVPVVEKKDITITIKDATKTFGTDNPTFDFTVPEDALVGTDSKMDLNVTFSTQAAKTSNVGTYDITGSADAANYNVTITNGTLTITKATTTVAPINKNYIYTVGSDGETESVDLKEQLPTDRGTTTYTCESTGGILNDVAVDENGVLTYKVAAGEVDETASVTITAASQNYEDITITVNVTLTNKIPVALKEGNTVEVADGKILTYGEKLSTLSFAEAVFETEDGTAVEGTLAWVEPDAVLNAGRQTVGWIFTPTESEKYTKVDGNVTITVEKATPNITVPTIEDITYNPSVTLEAITINGANGSWIVNGEETEVNGTWAWNDATIVPQIGNSGYMATFTPVDTTNYNIVTETIEVNVAKATPVVKTAPTASDIIYGNTLADSELTGGEVVYAESSDIAVKGTFTWKQTDLMPTVADSGKTAYEVVFTPENANEYETVTIKVVVTVEKKDITVTINNATKTFGTDNPKFDFTVSEGALVGTDSETDLNITLSTEATKTSDAGTYAITGSANAANYNVTVTAGTLTIGQAEALKIAPVNKNYIYTLGSEENMVSINLTEQLPTDRGTTTYTYKSTGDILSDVAVDENGVLTYKVTKGQLNETASIEVTIISNNYQDVVFVVNITLTDKIPVEVKDGYKVAIVDGKTLTYGEKLSALSLTEVVFETKDGVEVKGTLAWAKPDDRLDAGTKNAEWIFTPTESDKYAQVNGNLLVTVVKATPVVKTAPTASDIVYGNTLADSKLTDGEVVYAKDSDKIVTGKFTWKDASIAPTVADSNETAYEVVFTPTDTANYNTITYKITLVVEKAEWPFNTPEAKAEVDYDIAKVSDIKLQEGWEWTKEAVATELKLGEEVTVTAQYVADDKDNFKNTEVEIKVTRLAKAPYIEGDESTMGWNAIKEEIKETPNAETRVDMNGFTEIDTDVLQQLKEHPDATVVLVFEGGLTWTIKGSDVEGEEFDKYIDMGAELFDKDNEERPEIPQALIDSVAKSGNYKLLSLNHNGEFGFKAVLTLQLGKENAGKTVTIYYYDEANGKMGEPASYKADANGVVKYAFTHASDYVIAIEDAQETPNTPDNPETPDEKPNDETKSPDTGYYNVIMYMVSLLAVVSVLGIVFLKKRSKVN